MTTTATRPRRGLSRSGWYLTATVAAAALVTTGGILAGWEAQEDVTPGTVTSGELRLEEIDSSWEWSNDGTPFDPVAEQIVPGDTVIYREAVRLTLSSPGMTGTLSTTLEDVVAETVDDQELADAIIETATFEVNGVEYDGGARPVTHDDHGSVLDVALSVTLPSDTTAAMAQTVDLGDVHVTLRQGDGSDTPGDGDDGEGMDAAAAWAAYLQARSDLSTAQGASWTLGDLPLYTGMGEDDTVQAHLDQMAADGEDIEYTEESLRSVGVDFDATLQDALAYVQGERDAATDRREDALNALHTAGGTVTEHWVTETTFAFKATARSSVPIDAVELATDDQMSGWSNERPFTVEWGTDALNLPGADADGGFMTFDGSTPGTYTASWTLHEVDRDGNVLASTPMSVDLETETQEARWSLIDSDGVEYWAPDFAGGNFVDVSLWGHDVTGVDFTGAVMPQYLDGIDLSGSILAGADFSNVLMWDGLTLNGADLTDAHVNGTLITASDLDSWGVIYDGTTILN